jgi:23S rRNA (pseudouridine1915-N3)-methyltransferase
MKITLLVVGKTTETHIETGTAKYFKRLAHYINFSFKVIENIKQSGLQADLTKKKEGELILKTIQESDYVILLDEKGQQFSSEAFASNLQQYMNRGIKHVVFIIGGAYGFSDDIYKRANEKISLSSMTFPHQLIRLIFAEQLYRAFTIIKGEKYHHE